jgi:hypothetical protein
MQRVAGYPSTLFGPEVKMSKPSDEGGNGKNPERELDKFLAELAAVVKRYPRVRKEIEVLVGLRKTPGKAKSNAVAAAGPATALVQAFAARAQCNPACVPPKKCFILPGHGTTCK